MKPLFSFMVPIYNAEAYLSECLSSISNQAFRDFEVIMVDDGSTDQSSSIAKAFAEKDSRFKYFREENKGTSGATNTCLELISGEYFVNLDNDDYVSSELLSDAREIIDRCHPDIIQYQSIFIDKSGHVNSKQSFLQQELLFEGNQNLSNCEKTMPGAFNRTHSRKVFRTEVIGGNRFRGPAKGADTSFMRRILLQSERIVLSPKHMFFVREIATSESRKPGSPYFYKDWLEREMSDIDECIETSKKLKRSLPLWEFSDFIDYYQLYASKAVRDCCFDKPFFHQINKRIRKKKKYLIDLSAKSWLRWELWTRFTKACATRLAKRLPPGDFIV